ncbi:dihydrofolate reductase family protein [Amycolatopsis sp. w19]|uniref:dihydrofolate reductase family protein n=1 Tax=Amycolatopsis sp. w19 TaxID=3448134 RepID=UPI003F1B82B5
MYAEAGSTGAVISGRRTFELAGRWNGDHHDGVPIHVLTHTIDPADKPPGSAKFYTDVNACADEAREAAGDRAVLVHGAGAARALLAAGQLDELELHLVPVLLGDGRRLFEATELGNIELEPVRRLEGRDVTHLRYRVVHQERRSHRGIVHLSTST